MPECGQASGGGSGIRTHGGLPLTRFPSVPIRPLSHPSRKEAMLGDDRLQVARSQHVSGDPAALERFR